jgi:DNA-binding protein H-NS
MIDKFVEKLLQSVTSAYMPKFRDIAQTRSNELADMKAKVRTRPEDVEAWFEKEIEKISNVDVTGLMEKMRKSYDMDVTGLMEKMRKS